MNPTTTPTPIVFFGAKGGVGTSTMAAGSALSILAEDESRRVFLAGDDPDELTAVLGGNVARLTVTTAEGAAALAEAADVVVIDGGLTWDRPLPERARRLLVMPPCYLALRRYMANRRPVEGAVFVDQPGRVLTERDVAEILDPIPVVATVPWDPAIARSVDAGLLAARMPRVLHAATAAVVA